MLVLRSIPESRMGVECVLIYNPYAPPLLKPSTKPAPLVLSLSKGVSPTLQNLRRVNTRRHTISNIPPLLSPTRSSFGTEPALRYDRSVSLLLKPSTKPTPLV